MAKPPPTIAVTSTLAMVLTAGGRGFETADLLARFGVPPELLRDPDARLPAATVLALWEALVERTGDPALQLVAPLSLPFGAYRVIDYLVVESATVGQGVRRFASFFRLIAEGVALEVTEDGDGNGLVLGRSDGGAVPPIYVDYVFAALVTRVRVRSPGLRVLRVELRRPEPADPGPYHEVFRAPVLFAARADRLLFSREEWDSPLGGGDEALAEVLEEHAKILAQRMPEADAGFRVEVERAVAATVPGGPSVEAVARALHVSVRTLQRKLVAEGTSFREVAEAVLGRLALDYLADRQVSVAEVAFLLGFSDPSSFNRAFRRWTGDTPGRWRRRGARLG